MQNDRGDGHTITAAVFPQNEKEPFRRATRPKESKHKSSRSSDLRINSAARLLEAFASMAGFRLCGTFALTAAAPFGTFTRIHYSLCHPCADSRALDRIQLLKTLYAGAADLSIGISEEDIKVLIMRSAYETQKGIDIVRQDVVR